MAIVVYQKYLHFVFIFTSLLQYAFAEQDCLPNLAQNTVVYEGATASFPRAANGDTAQWQLGPSNDPNSFVSITNPDGTVDPQYATTYAVNSSQLKISKATTAPEGTMSFATAGLYLLIYQDAGCTVGAGLVVIKSGPICVCDTSDPNDVKMTCSVDFAEYSQQQINPIITWKNSSGTVVKESVPPRTPLDGNNYGLQNSTDSLPVSNDDSTTYECQLTFTAPPNDGSIPTSIAQNAPNFTASCFISNVLATTTTTTNTTTTMMITTTTMMTTGGESTSNPSLPSASVVALSFPSSATAAATDTPVTSTSASTPSVHTPSTSMPSSSSTSPSGQSPLSSAPVATRPPARTTTAIPDNNDAVGKTLAISLGLVLGAFAVGAVACSCWCTGCCLLLPVGAKRTKQPQRRRYYQTPYFSPRWYPDIEET